MMRFLDLAPIDLQIDILIDCFGVYVILSLTIF